jgi:hypothetical protein
VGNNTIEHWNGHTWKAFSTPYVFSALTVVSASDIWVVGSGEKCNYNGCPPPYTVTEHWDGWAWSTVSSVTPYRSDLKVFAGELLAVRAFSTSDVWAAGDSYGNFLVEHWDGHIWKLVGMN